MGTTQFTCERPGCESILEVGDEESELRCNVCGTVNTEPWGETEVPETEDETASPPVTRVSGGNVVCRRCGNPFDPGRTPVVRGQDTSRCPGCGAKHDLDESERAAVPAQATGGRESVPVGSGGFSPGDVVAALTERAGDGVELHLHQHEHHHG